MAHSTGSLYHSRTREIMKDSDLYRAGACGARERNIMSGTSPNVYDHVGPVLQAGTIGSAVVAAIRDLNQDVLVMDRGAYLRVLVPGRCVVTREAIEEHLGRSFRFPGE